MREHPAGPPSALAAARCRALRRFQRLTVSRRNSTAHFRLRAVDDVVRARGATSDRRAIGERRASQRLIFSAPLRRRPNLAMDMGNVAISLPQSDSVSYAAACAALPPPERARTNRDRLRGRRVANPRTSAPPGPALYIPNPSADVRGLE